MALIGVVELNQPQTTAYSHYREDCSTLINEQRNARNKRRSDQRAKEKKLRRKSLNVKNTHFEIIY